MITGAANEADAKTVGKQIAQIFSQLASSHPELKIGNVKFAGFKVDWKGTNG